MCGTYRVLDQIAICSYSCGPLHEGVGRLVVPWTKYSVVEIETVVSVEPPF